VAVSVESLGALKHVKKDSRLPSPGAVLDILRLAPIVARKARHCDVLYANSQKAFVVAASAGLLAHRPVVWHLRDILAPPHFSPANVKAAAALANLRAKRVIANSRATLEAFLAAGGRAGLARVVHNGIDPAPFDAVTEADARDARMTLGIPADAFVVALFGRFHPWKGQQVLLRALANVPDVHGLIVGAPLFGEEEFEAALHHDAKRLGLSGRAHFLGHRGDVPVLMRAADVIVHASTTPEPFGRVLVEGMLARRPVIATRAGGVLEIISDGQTGLLVPPSDAPSLASAITALRDDFARARAIAERGAAHARANFTLAAMVRGVEDAIAGL
jgi:glycosyltransferase involved in cell wall biosynthesis